MRVFEWVPFCWCTLSFAELMFAMTVNPGPKPCFTKPYSSACLCSFFSSFVFLPLFLSLQCIHSSWGVFVLNVPLGFSQSFFFYLQFDSLTEKYVWTVSNCILTCVCILILPCLSSCQRCLLFCSKSIWKQMGANQRVPHHSVVTKTEHTQTHTHTNLVKN